ncbi:MAG: hypothetical protein PHY34_05410 [Patescibacteria group bacterium]|nr:hypothetical protein [Patescibacteria group bacterium]MDD5715669.1 hypothetical protein [Patescibacteria group bacterium]
MVQVRRATLDDSGAVSRLMAEKYSFNTLEEAHARFQSECSYQHFRIAEDDGTIVGIIGWRPQGLLKHGVAELTRLAIARSVMDPQYVKEMLFDVMVAEADYFYKERGYRLRKIFSMIHADCAHIKEFFLNKGMQQEAVLRDHYHNGKDELLFSLFMPS